jgi:hypothetical protein
LSAQWVQNGGNASPVRNDTRTLTEGVNVASQFVRPFRSAVTVLLASLVTVTAFAAGPVHIVKTDMKAGIRSGFDSPVQFAVLVPHEVSTTTDGTWSVQAGRATWRYAIQVPTAVSLSFHAVRSALPDGATLIVQGAKTTTSYRARDLRRGELWSRIQPGDALQFTLTVPAADRGKVALGIVSLQAGYRALGPGVEDHPYYRQLKRQLAQASGNMSCVTNYECQVTAANTPAGSATVALVFGNLYQCSGTLINDVPGDNTPYVLTARHCESGKVGGGDPGAASSVTVYWDANSSCQAALGSIYDPNIPTQTGAQTVVEQQDAWLIMLDVNPVVADARLAGFDASGGAVQGGYTIHHAEGNDKQFTGWYGQAAAVQQNDVLGSNYLSNFWETVNQIGNVGPGASGSGLFDQHDHLVGALSLGRQTNDPSGYQSCPVASPPAPDGTNGVADFTALASVWDSIADTTSSTGSTTIKSVLDPANTGTLVVPSAAAEVVSLSANSSSLPSGQPDRLTWSAANAKQCTAGGGVTGDGWAGTISAAGTQTVSETVTAIVTYTLVCSYPGGRTSRASTTINWTGPVPQLSFTAPMHLWTTRPAVLAWSSNVTPCSITGGGLSLSNLPGSGTTTTTQATSGDVTYRLLCGPPNDNAELPVTVSYVTPDLILEANGTDRKLGQAFALTWLTYADACTPSGGAPNDGWATTSFAQNGPQQFSPTVTTTGTYTYTLTCSSGPLSVQMSVTVAFENDAPYVTASLSTSTVTLTDSPADYVTLTYDSNVTTCGPSTTPVLVANLNDPLAQFNPPQGTVTLSPARHGTYQIQMVCDQRAATPLTSTTLTLTVLPPPPPVATITLTPSTVLGGQPFTIAWSATNAASCIATGGPPGSGWTSMGLLPPAGSTAEGAGEPPGQYTFSMFCHSIDVSEPDGPVAQATLNIETLTAALTTSSATVNSGSSFTLTWSSTAATSCTASGGGANGSPWSGSLGTSGSVTQTATTSGTFTYTLTCGLNNTLTDSTVQVTVPATSSGSGGSGGGSSGGGGGGGALGFLELALLGALGAHRRLRSVRGTAARQRAA